MGLALTHIFADNVGKSYLIIQILIYRKIEAYQAIHIKIGGSIMKNMIKIIAFLCLILTFTGCNNKDENMAWAQNLKVGDVEKIEAVSMPNLENERYKNYDVSEFANIVEIVNNANGKKIENPEEFTGGGITFYITTTDGERHTFTNDSNAYLVIDGVSYEATYDYLSKWGDYNFNSKVPDDFVY